ncbi:MAG: hypothetical protein HY520_04975 [Candidatus Aenigmarchaeota archaeon]|nr:hypothetical protein [Candidatus Aenigmarchaeota archaeon]
MRKRVPPAPRAPARSARAVPEEDYAPAAEQEPARRIPPAPARLLPPLPQRLPPAPRPDRAPPEEAAIRSPEDWAPPVAEEPPAGWEARASLPEGPWQPPRQAPQRRAPAPHEEGEGRKDKRGPPLFIKIEKYQEVVNTLHKLKTFSLSLRDALDALADVERELRNGVVIAHKALDHFNQTIATLDTKISRLPPEEDMDLAERQDMGEMDAYVQNLHQQVQKIRHDLKGAVPQE